MPIDFSYEFNGDNYGGKHYAFMRSLGLYSDPNGRDPGYSDSHGEFSAAFNEIAADPKEAQRKMTFLLSSMGSDDGLSFVRSFIWQAVEQKKPEAFDYIERRFFDDVPGFSWQWDIRRTIIGFCTGSFGERTGFTEAFKSWLSKRPEDDVINRHEFVDDIIVGLAREIEWNKFLVKGGPANGPDAWSIEASLRWLQEDTFSFLQDFAPHGIEPAIERAKARAVTAGELKPCEDVMKCMTALSEDYKTFLAQPKPRSAPGGGPKAGT
jgi:hypothetical protein